MNSATASAAATMSSRRSASRLIKQPRLRNDFSPERLSQSAFRNQIHLAAQKLAQLALRCEMAQQADIRSRQKLDQEVDVAVRPHLPTRRRSEKRQFLYLITAAQFRDLGLVQANGRWERA